MQINIRIKYLEKENKYKSFIEYKNSVLHKDFETIKLLLNIIGERCEYNINNCKMVDIKDIFINARYDNMIDFIVDYKIFNSNKIYGTEGWGIEYNINNL